MSENKRLDPDLSVFANEKEIFLHPKTKQEFTFDDLITLHHSLEY